MDWNWHRLRSNQVDEIAYIVGQVGRRWWAAPAAVGALGWGLAVALPQRLARRGTPERARLAQTAGRQALGWGALDLALTAGLPLLRISYAPIRPAFLYLFCGRAAWATGLTALGLASPHWGRDLAPATRRTLTAAAWVGHLALTALIVHATYWGGAHLSISRYRLRLPSRPDPPTATYPIRNPQSAIRIRLAQVSDIHMERRTRRDSAVVAALRAARPDVIVLTGDFINIDYYDVPAYEALRTLMVEIGALAPPLGVYACLGNVDQPEITAVLLAGTGVQLLDDTAVTLPWAGRRVQFIGARTTRGHRWLVDLPHFTAALAVAATQGPADLRVLLYHTPDLAPQAAAAGIDLYFCGHTHGGQIRVPIIGALRTGSRFGRRYVMGLHRLANGGYLHTSRGAGFEGMALPRVRVLCPPEVAVFDVLK